MSKALLKKLQHAHAKGERAPAGWFTAQQWADKWGLSLRSAGLYLRSGEKEKLVEKKKFRITTGRGVYPVPHFREI